MPERGARDAAELIAALSVPCACARYPATGADPMRLIEDGALTGEVRRVHQEPQCTEHVVTCTACGTRYWVIEDNAHWSGPGFTWTTQPPLI